MSIIRVKTYEANVYLIDIMRMMKLMVLMHLMITLNAFSGTYSFKRNQRRGSHCTSSLFGTGTIETLDGTKGISDSILAEASNFMLSAFWNSNSLNELNSNDDSSKKKLLDLQKMDFDVRFGEILGKRQLQTGLIVSRDEFQNINGIVGVEMSLWNKEEKILLSYDQSESKLKGAISDLGPKQRRQFKDASIVDLVSQLPSLGGKYEAVAVLCNLAVSPSSRGTGLGTSLCNSIEDIVRGSWGIIDSKIVLNVEEQNKPAVNLYKKLGYKEETMKNDVLAIRADFVTGSFVEIPCNMLTLSKII